MNKITVVKCSNGNIRLFNISKESDKDLCNKEIMNNGKAIYNFESDLDETELRKGLDLALSSDRSLLCSMLGSQAELVVNCIMNNAPVRSVSECDKQLINYIVAGADKHFENNESNRLNHSDLKTVDYIASGANAKRK